MKHIVLLAFCTIQTAWAQTDYKATTIPATLKENAHAVVREHETVFTVKSIGEAQTYNRTVITVLDEQGDGQAKRTEWYDKLSKITNFEGALYDAGGKLIRKLKKADISDYSTYSDYNFFDDDRYKTASFPKQPSYPYTVEFIVETTERNLMAYPTWAPQNEEFLAIEHATFTVNMPANLALRYKERNLPNAAVVTTTTDGGKTFVWKLSNIPAVEFEPHSPPVQEQLPVVYTAPTDFEVQDYKGKLTTWSDLGAFYNSLNDNRDRIPDALRQQVIELTKNETTTAGKVRKLYSFLQSQTRYVSIQLGIGGWQTIEAEKVAMNKYGDCKALTNYMKALLKTVGVPSYPALVRAGDSEPDALIDFPSFQFNHVILCVPDKRDTLFLECTDGHNPMGYLSDFTGNRHALLILPAGSHLIKTPVYQPTDNRQLRQIVVNVTEQGDATADARTRFTGLQHDKYSAIIHNMSRDEQRSWLIKHTSIPAFELNTFALTEEPGAIPAATANLKLAIRRWATISGTRLFLPLNLMSALGPAAPMTHPRKAPLKLGTEYDYDDSDTVTYQLPKGYTPEYQIEPVTISSKFGQYTAQLKLDGDRVIYTRHITMHGGTFPAAAYTEWVDFRKKVAKADRMQLVFVKSN
ncbi:DUF3857 domain-containing transglutaminase family protein [Spirosoma sp. KNUC1025]|uniref:DUF3857 domain-containing transglutaminase family protein n=1 Tax=Spirosoma sp. KNUC1025 TaxID=2894082 RepID=UPI00386935FC|nr:DUF3857 and transglutaminase domain-containing protein [Spirosoma sp. KNUC1025]